MDEQKTAAQESQAMMMGDQERNSACNALGGAIDELSTIRNYFNIMQGSTSEVEKAKYAEIIADELNHVEVFVNIFIEKSGIQPKED